MDTSSIVYGWNEVATEAVLAVTAVAIVALAAVVPQQARKWLSVLGFAGLLGALLVEVFYVPESADTLFAGLLSKDSSFSAFAIACAMLSTLMGVAYFSKGGKNRSEFLAVLIICTMGMILFVRSNNLMVAFVALECVTLCLYVMAAWAHNKSASLEAGVKYLVISGVSGATLLLGIAFVYGAGLATHIDLLNFANFSAGLYSPVFRIGMVLIAAGLLFKIAAVPFQFWTPDVYQGAPTPVTAFFAVASKAAGIIFLSRMCIALGPMGDRAELAFSVIAALTILVGNLGAVTQVNVKRLMGFSSIANAGYLLVLIIAMMKLRNVDEFYFAVYFYIVAYMLATYAIFFVVNQFEGYDDYDQSISDYRGLSRKSATMTGSLVVNLASLAGIPPTAGFFGKLLILIFAWAAQMYWLMGIMIFGSVVSIYYYFAWMRAAFDTPSGTEKEIQPSISLLPTMVALSILTLVFSGVLLKFYAV